METIFKRVNVIYECPYCDTNLSGGGQVICPACMKSVKYPIEIRWSKDKPTQCPKCSSKNIMMWINHDKAMCHDCDTHWAY